MKKGHFVRDIEHVRCPNCLEPATLVGTNIKHRSLYKCANGHAGCNGMHFSSTTNDDVEIEPEDLRKFVNALPKGTVCPKVW